MLDNNDELYFDVQGLAGTQSVEHLVELLTKVSAGILVTWFSLRELMDEINEYKSLKEERKKETHA